MKREIRLDHCWAPSSGAQPHCGGRQCPLKPTPTSASSDISIAAPIFTAPLLSIVRPILMRRGGTKHRSATGMGFQWQGHAAAALGRW